MSWSPTAEQPRESSLLTASCLRPSHPDSLQSEHHTVITMSVSVGVSFVVSLTVDIILIFLGTISVVEFDEIKTTKKSPIEQCEFLNPLVSICQPLLYLYNNSSLSFWRFCQNTASKPWSASSSYLWLTGLLVYSTSHCWHITFTGSSLLCCLDSQLNINLTHYQVLESTGDELSRPAWSNINPRYQEHPAVSSGGVDQAGLLHFNIFLLRLWICDSIQLIIYINSLQRCFTNAV